MPRPLALLVAVLAATPLPLNSAAAQVRNGWWPRQVDLNDVPAADQAIMRRNLMAAEQLMTRTSGYANPIGFESVAAWRVQASSGPHDVREYWVEMGSYVSTRAAAGGATNASAWIRFNPSFGFLAEGAITSETGEVYYNEFPRSERDYGATAVYGKFGEFNNALMVLFTAGDREPMQPVTREEFLRAQIHSLAKDAAELKDAQQSATKTAYQQWMEGAAQRKKDREATVAAMPDKAAGARLRAELEKTEGEVTENLKQRDAQDAANLRTFRALDPAAKLREQLAAMPPEERASPAWAGATQLMPANAPGAKRVVRVDPAFLRARGSPARPLAILVRLREPTQGLEHADTTLSRVRLGGSEKAARPVGRE